MRLWTIDPFYLDSKGLLGLWRETLLAQAVLLGKTQAYKNHPQLDRFKQHAKPLEAIGFYLSEIAEVAKNEHGYNFDVSKIVFYPENDLVKIPVSKAQVFYEIQHLVKKLELRDPSQAKAVKNWADHDCLQVNPLFKVDAAREGVEKWEKIIK